MNVGLGLTGKIHHLITREEELTFSREFAGIWLVALSVNKHLPHYLKTLCTDRCLVYCGLPVAVSPQVHSQLMMMVDLPPREQGRASYVLGPQARLIFSYVRYMDLVSAFFQRVQNHNLFYL